MLAVVGVTLVACVVIVDVGNYLGARLHAAASADAAALAAAPETFPRVSRQTPGAAASRIAAANGVELETCRCRVDPSWRSRRVEVVVVHSVELVVLGRQEVRAHGSAEFSPIDAVTSIVGERPQPDADEASRTGLVERFVEVAALR